MADISKIKLPNDNNTYNLADLVARGRIWQGTQAQYDALVQAGTIDPDTIYFVTDGTTVACASNEVTYDHTVSGLSATDVKGALDELASEKMNKADPTGTGSLSINRKAETTVGSNSATLGLGCTASANQTFAAGYNNEASGVTACAVNSTNIASGSGSFCCGYGNIAQRQFNHVFGMYNQADTGGTDTTTKGNYIEIVGKGTNQNSRSNARTLDWSGNEVLAGDLTFSGAISLANMNKVAVSDRQYVIQSGTLNANSYGYIAVSVNVPSGYKTTGWISIYLGHPVAAGGLQLCGGIQKKQTGTITIYLSYFTPVAISAASTDFFVNVGIINSNVNID